MDAARVTADDNRPPTDPGSFQAAVNRRVAALGPKADGYLTLAGALLGMVLYAAFGPNDIWTALLVGAVFGALAARFLVRLVFTGLEALKSRRLELAVVLTGLVVVIAIWLFSR